MDNSRAGVERGVWRRVTATILALIIRFKKAIHHFSHLHFLLPSLNSQSQFHQLRAEVMVNCSDKSSLKCGKLAGFCGKASINLSFRRAGLSPFDSLQRVSVETVPNVKTWLMMRAEMACTSSTVCQRRDIKKWWVHSLPWRCLYIPWWDNTRKDRSFWGELCLINVAAKPTALSSKFYSNNSRDECTELQLQRRRMYIRHISQRP